MFETVETTEGTIRLNGEATIHDVTTVWRLLVDATADRRELTLDLGGLTELDTAGAQLLLASRRSGAVSRVHSCPAPIRSFLASIGIAEQVL
jgi:ABC-type transporter Mla MlaB component